MVLCYMGKLEEENYSAQNTSVKGWPWPSLKYCSSGVESLSGKGHSVLREDTKICFVNVCKGLPCIISASVGVVLYTITQKQKVLFVFMYFLLYCEWASALSAAECCTSTHVIQSKV